MKWCCLLVLLNLTHFATTQIFAVTHRTFDLDLFVFSFGSQKPVEGAVVQLIAIEKETFLGKTDSDGKIQIKGLRGKAISIQVYDTTNNFLPKTISLDDIKFDVIQRNVYLRWTAETEKREFAAIDEKYHLDSTLCARLNADSTFLKDSLLWEEKAKDLGKRFMNFVAENMEYPPSAIEFGLQGRVYVEFVVQCDGTITNVRLAKGVDSEMDAEALRLVRYYANFGSQEDEEGRFSKMRARIPINFTLH